MKNAFTIIAITLAVLFVWQVNALSQTPAGSDFYYVGNINECSNILYMCEEGWDTFSDSAGCGCKMNKTSEVKMCTMEYAPVCGKTQAKVCLSLDCAAHDKTYSNKCQLESDGATFLYEGECKDKYTLPEATDTKHYVGDTKMCQIMKYTCEDGWDYFGDEIGCGCEKDEISKETKVKIDTLLDSFVGGLRDKNYTEEKVGEVLREVSIRLQILRESRPEYIGIINYTLQWLDNY